MTPEQQYEVNKIIFEAHMEMRRKSLDLQGEYGKWLIASLLLIHGGAFAFLAKGDGYSQKIFEATYLWFFGGLLAALLCGFLTWINWGQNWDFYDDTHPAMIYQTDAQPSYDQKKANRIGLTYWASVIVGFISAACIVGAAVSIAMIR